jgi:hypothetical protein
LEHPNALRIVQDMEDFHPTKENVDNHIDSEDNQGQISKMMTMLQTQYTGAQVSELVDLANENGVQSRNSLPLLSKDILRLLLALRYNGLESGVYRDVAMLNHSCHPNCTKIFPPVGQAYSEVRTTRTVQAGASLTIFYLPRVQSHASRRKYLWEHHRFDIGANYLKGEELKMEFVGKSLPPSSIQRWDETSPTHRIEKATEELENLPHELTSDVASGMASPQHWEMVKALEQTSLELYNESVQQLGNERHLLLVPVLLIHLDACALVQKAPSMAGSVQLGILARQVLTAKRLLPLQSAFHGPDHFDLARTYLDLANAIGELLSRSSKRLYELNISSLKSFGEWSAFEHKSRKEHNRIKALYPHDAEELMRQNSEAKLQFS